MMHYDAGREREIGVKQFTYSVRFGSIVPDYYNNRQKVVSATFKRGN